MNYAKNNKLNFNLILTHFFNERLLYRLSLSNYSPNFILKGALLFLAHDISPFRPTKDIDLLGNNISNDIEDIKEIFSEIAGILVEDGVSFDTKSISAERIKEPDEYNGVRLKLFARLDSVRLRVQIDIGFGDALDCKPILIDYPIILDLENPRIFAYSLETAIAEKFEAIVSLGLSNSRMKDFYDIYFLSTSQSFKSTELIRSIKGTFKRRNTKLDDRAFLYADNFVNDKEKQIMWLAFLNRNQIDINLTFSGVMDRIRDFIEPITHQEITTVWSPFEGEWR